MIELLVDILIVMSIGTLIVITGSMLYYIMKSKSPEDIEIETKLKEIHW